MLDKGAESGFALLEGVSGAGALGEIGDFALGESDADIEPVEFEGFGEIVIRTGSNDELDIIWFAASGEHQDGASGTTRTRPEAAAEIDAIETREVPIENRQVEDSIVNGSPG